MSEFHDFDLPEEDKQQFIEGVISDGEAMRAQLNRILKTSQIDANKIKNSLHLNALYGSEILFANNSSIENVTITEPQHPNGDIPEYTEEDDYLQDFPVHKIHDEVLKHLSLKERKKVQIHRESAEDTIQTFKGNGDRFDLVTNLNIFPYKLESRIEDIARQMLSVTKPGGVVIITTQEGDDTILNLLSQKLQNDPEISRIHVQPVSGDSKETPMEALGTLAIIIQKN